MAINDSRYFTMEVYDNSLILTNLIPVKPFNHKY